MTSRMLAWAVIALLGTVPTAARANRVGVAKTMVAFGADKLPKAPRGFKWERTGREFETFPVQYEYQLKRTSALKVKTRVTAHEDKLPSAPIGFRWTKTGRVYETYPPKFEFVLSPAK